MVMSPAVSAIALICVLFWSEAFAQAKTYWYCQFTPFGQQNVRYLSDVLVRPRTPCQWTAAQNRKSWTV